jgi:hypothetical protein
MTTNLTNLVDVFPAYETTQVLVVPLSATVSDLKASRFEVRDAAAAAMLRVDAVARTVTSAVPVVFPSMDSTERDALTAVAGMVIFNNQTGLIEWYDGNTWCAPVKAS